MEKGSSAQWPNAALGIPVGPEMISSGRLARNWVSILNSQQMPTGTTVYRLHRTPNSGQGEDVSILVQDKRPGQPKKDEGEKDDEESKRVEVKHDPTLVRRESRPRTIVDSDGYFNSFTHSYSKFKLRIVPKRVETLIRQWIRVSSNVDGKKTLHCDGWDRENLSRHGSGTMVADKFKTETGKDAGFLRAKKGKDREVAVSSDTPGFHADWIKQLANTKSAGRNKTVKILFEFVTLLCERVFDTKKKKWSDWTTKSYETWWVYFTVDVVNGQAETRKSSKSAPTRNQGKGAPPKNVTGKEGMGIESTLHDEVVKEQPDSNSSRLSISCTSD
jgi:hypothetical protein